MTQLARVAITLDSQVLSVVELRVAEYRNRFVHYLHRTLVGAEPTDTFQLPLCWHAHQQERGGDDDDWWLSVDHGAIVLSEHIGTYDRELVTCSDCIEWLRS